MNKPSYFTTSFDEILENTSSNNIVGSKIEAATSELESTIEVEPDKITAYHTKTIDSFDMKISAITSKNLVFPMKNLLMISSNGQYSNHPKQFTCITVHQTSVFH